MRYMVCISKRFDKPEIHYHIVNHELSLQMELPKFLSALVSQIPVWKIFSRKALLNALSEASDKVVQDMKDQSIHSPPPIK